MDKCDLGYTSRMVLPPHPTIKSIIAVREHWQTHLAMRDSIGITSIRPRVTDGTKPVGWPGTRGAAAVEVRPGDAGGPDDQVNAAFR